MVSARYPIEKWNRPQLEDHFHKIAEELQKAQKKVKEQEKQITTFNSRFRRSMLERKSRDEKVVERSKYDDVMKENQILDMKLKAAKQQLLIYTAPSARATTASMMTGRSTFRQPPSTFRHRQPLTGGTTGSIDRPPTAPVLRKKSDGGGEKLQLATDEKLTIVRLNRTLKNKNDEIAELKYTIEKLRTLKSNGSAPPSRLSTASSSKSSSNNNNYDDEKDSELEEISEMLESGRSTPIVEERKPRRGSRGGKRHDPLPVPVEPPRIPDQTEKVLIDKLKIAENDLAILREECELVKKSNERLVQQSLSKSTEYGARESLEEKKRIVELEEQLKETERRIKESEHKRREDQKKFESMRLHYKTKYETVKAETKQKAIDGSAAAGTNVKIEEDDGANSPPPITYEPLRKRPSQSDVSRMRRADDDLLQKLYKEVSDILHSHDVGIAEMNNLGISGENGVIRWQKLYSELYEELEKVRNMLIVQYDINQKQNKEIQLLKDELERLKTVTAEILSKAKNEAKEKQKKIFILEEQIRTIAYSGQQSVKLLSNKIDIPTPRLNTDLSIKLINVNPAPYLTFKFFFSLEFFDFQLETTPIMDPKQQSMDFTTIYDVLVSNLLIHYLQTNGITIEMYRPANDDYKLIAAATISLIPLFEDSFFRKFCSEIVLKSVDSGVEMCTLRYEIEVSQPICDSFKKFQKSETARNMLPLQLEHGETDEQDFEPLTIMINRVIGLKSLVGESPSEFCVVYEFMSLSPYFTEFSMNSEIRSKRDVPIPKTDVAKSLFATSTISFFLIENAPKQDGVLATLQLPLHPLCKLGGAIKGTFPMLDTDGRSSSVSLDLCLIWKHEIPSFFLKQEPEKEESNNEKHSENEVKDTPILPQPVRRVSKQFDIIPVKYHEGTEESKSSELVPDKHQFPLRSDLTSSSDSLFSNTNENLFKLPKTTPLAFDYDLPETPIVPTSEKEEEDRIVFDDDDDEEIESISAISSLRGTETPIIPEFSSPTLPRELSDPLINREEMSSNYLKAVSAEAEHKSQEDDNSGTSIPPEHSNITSGQNLDESGESTPITQRSVEEGSSEPRTASEKDGEHEGNAEDGKISTLKTEELKSLLGVLPPIAKPRSIPAGPIDLTEEQDKPGKLLGTTGRIAFTDPLHYSVPPSESSSTSSPRRPEKAPVPLPDYQGHSLIKVKKPLSPKDKDNLEPEMRVSIQLEQFELVPGSSLTPWTREETKCFVDWVFLDFSNEESKSKIFDFPRRPQESVEINFSKEYTLTRGQLSLLNQWIFASVKFELTIIKISPGEEEELGFGSIILVPNNTQNKSFVIDVYDRSGIVQAELTITIQFSKALLEQFD